MITYYVHVHVTKCHLVGSEATFPYLKSRVYYGLPICNITFRTQILLVIPFIHLIQVVLIPIKDNLSYFFSRITNLTKWNSAYKWDYHENV